MKTTESNKLIAEFMGWTFHPEERETALEYIENTWSPPNSSKIFLPREWKFHKSWDWLMPVVEKIQEKEGQVRTTMKHPLYNKPYLVLFKNGEGWGKTELEAIYNAVIEFIKWYNKEKK